MQANINKLKNEKELEYYKYLQCLLHPETSKGCKVPSNVPIASCTFQIKKKFIYHIRSEDVIFINPWFIYCDKLDGLTFMVNGRPPEYIFRSWTPALRPFNVYSQPNVFMGWAPDNANETPFFYVPAIPDIYSKYRLVSASLSVRYDGPLTGTKGFIGGGVTQRGDIFLCPKDEYNGAIGPQYMIINSTSWNELMHEPTYRMSDSLSGLRLLYYPIDNSYLEFAKVASSRDDTIALKFNDRLGNAFILPKEECYRRRFTWFVCIGGYEDVGFGDTPERDFVFELCCNFEALPKANMEPFLYKDISTYIRLSDAEIKDVIRKVMEHCLGVNVIDKIPLLETKKPLNTNIDYLTCLLYPEKSKGCKIPSGVPVPTCTVQKSSSFLFAPRSDNVFVIDPWFLYSQDAIEGVAYNLKGMTSGWQSWQDDPTNRFRPFGRLAEKVPSVRQDIPNMFNKYRLVSASLKVTYADAIQNVEGMICGGVVLRKVDIGGYYDPNETYLSGHMKLGDFGLDVIRNVPSYKEVLCLEGLRMLYYPVDNSYLEFTKLVTKNDITVKDVDTDLEEFKYIDVNKECYRSGFAWVIYFKGIPDQDLWFKFDVCCNFELIPKADYIHFFNVQVGDKKKLNDDERKKLLEKVMSQSIQCINITK